LNIPNTVNLVVLSVHLFAAVIFIGGSFFLWLIVMPGLRDVTRDEAERMRIVGRLSKAFGTLTEALLAVLVLTGIYNASWYLPSFGALFSTYGGMLLLVKSILVAVLIALVSVHGAYYGRKIVEMAREGRFDEVERLRKRSRPISYVNLALMAAILVLATMLQMPP
jgi:copper resistance protein D